MICMIVSRREIDALGLGARSARSGDLAILAILSGHIYLFLRSPTYKDRHTRYIPGTCTVVILS